MKIYGDAFYKPITDGETPKFVKVVPKQIQEWLTPRGLAFWYMDDGSMKSKHHKLVYLNTQSFTFEENELLCDVLTKKFQLQTEIKVNGGKCQIAIHGSSLERLRQLIEPYMYAEIKVLPAPAKRRGKGKKTLAAEAIKAAQANQNTNQLNNNK